MKLKDQVNRILNNKTSLYIIIAVLGISLLVGIFRYMELNKEKNRYIKENELVILKYKMTQQKLDTLYNVNKRLIQSQQMVQTESKDAINQLSQEVFNLKKKDEKHLQTIALMSTNQRVRVDTLRVPFNDSSNVEASIKDKDSSQLTNLIRDSMILVPKKVSYEDSTISVAATITKKSFTLDSLTIPNTLHQRIVLDKGGLFKKDAYRLQSFNTSKYVGTTKEESVIYVPSKKNTFLKILMTAIVAGAGTYILTH